MANKPIISVVIPLYNPELKVFRECILSLLKQSYEKIEIIIVDDSSDPQKNINFLNEFHSNKITHFAPKKKLGLAASLNKGIELSKGDFIARADCDDYYHQDRIKQQVDFLCSNKEVELCGTNCIKVDLNNNELGIRKYPQKNISIKKRMHITSPFAHPSVVFRKSFFKKYGFYRTDIDIEDYELWLRSKSKGCIFYNLQENLTFLRVEEVSEFSRPRHWKENLIHKINYFDKEFLVESSIGVLLFYFVSIIPTQISKKIYEVFQNLR